MQTKLTLRLDDELIRKAKSWAKTHRMSLSRAVGELLSRLPEQNGPPALSSWTRRLIGVASHKGRVTGDEAIRRKYRQFLAKKHR